MPYADYTTDPNVIVCEEDIVDYGVEDFDDDHGLSDAVALMNLQSTSDFSGAFTGVGTPNGPSFTSGLPSEEQKKLEEELIPDLVSLQIDTLKRKIAEVQSTVFDIRDPKAFERLEDVASDQKVAGAVKEITLTCCVIPEFYPDALRMSPLEPEVQRDPDAMEETFEDEYEFEELPRDLYADFVKIQQRERSFFANVFKRATHRSMDFEHAWAFLGLENSETENLLYRLANLLHQFPNLVRVSYVYEPDQVPARYAHLAGREKNPDTFYEWSLLHDREGVIGAQIGLALVLWALQRAAIRLKQLELAVLGETYWAFCMPRMSSKVWKQGFDKDPGLEVLRLVCSEVESLTLHSIKAPVNFENTSLSIRDVSFTCENFPLLSTLRIDRSKFDKDDRLYAQARLSRVWEPSRISTLIIEGSVGLHSELVEFFKVYDRPLRTLKLVDTRVVSWEPILRVLPNLDLDEISISCTSDSALEELVDGLSYVQLNPLRSAPLVNLEPEDLWDRIEEFRLQRMSRMFDGVRIGEEIDREKEDEEVLEADMMEEVVHSDPEREEREELVAIDGYDPLDIDYGGGWTDYRPPR